jgi:CheY-like chemotaxis protein
VVYVDEENPNFDDNPDVRYVLHAHLEWMGCTAITAETGKYAVKVAIAENPDLILMDITMPEMDGRETTRVLRSNPESKNIPILATTALLRRAAELSLRVER